MPTRFSLKGLAVAHRGITICGRKGGKVPFKKKKNLGVLRQSLATYPCLALNSGDHLRLPSECWIE